MNKKIPITVLGSGVSGLTTAICLLEAGYTVHLISKDLYEHTTSAVAAAIWFPYSAEPARQVNKWSYETYLVLSKLAGLKDSGVRMLDFLVLSARGREDLWLQGLPAKAVRAASKAELPPAYERGYIANVPLADTTFYLPYLRSRIQELGGTMKQRQLNSLEQLAMDNNIYINCTGMGSRTLFNDTKLYPVRGQVLKVPKYFSATSMVDSMEAGRLAYIIERDKDFVLGGTDYEHDYDETPRQEDTEKIKARFQRLAPGKTIPDNYTVGVGLRPKRYAIRCEWDEKLPIIHNYGHGGAGFTVSWGCANEILMLLEHSSPNFHPA